jgi:hypothetical protein
MYSFPSSINEKAGLLRSGSNFGSREIRLQDEHFLQVCHEILDVRCSRQVAKALI